MTTTIIPIHKCQCGYEMDRTSGAYGDYDIPSENDYSLCLKCGLVTQFNKDLTQRRVTEAELKDLALTQPQAFMQLMNAQAQVLEHAHLL